MSAKKTLKIEAVAQVPPSPQPYSFEEAVVIRVSEEPFISFHDAGEEDHWYRVVATNDTICEIEVVSTAVLSPSCDIQPPSARPRAEEFATVCDCGVLLALTSGIVPGVQIENSFGFATWPEVRVYTALEVLKALDNRYERRSV